MEQLKITENKNEMSEIGRQIANEHKDIYTPLMLSKILAKIEAELPEKSCEEKEIIMYISIYDFWVYGNNIDEEFYYNFYEKTHEEKKSYMTYRILTLYVDYLCCGSPYAEKNFRRKTIDQLELKYECYKLFKPYYKRDVIEIKDTDDFPLFETFVKKHNVFVAKPSNFCYGTGVHKVSMDNYSNTHKAFRSLLSEGIQTSKKHPSRKRSIVLEELINQSSEMEKIHPGSVNSVRITAVRDKNGKVVIHHPWFQVAFGNNFTAFDAFAEVDVNTGIVITDGCSEDGTKYECHPDTKIKFKGFKIPEWDNLKALIEELMSVIPSYRYVGWDMAYTSDGWCVIEANYGGECMWQMINSKGCREELEELIGWKMKEEFWWQVLPFENFEKKGSNEKNTNLKVKKSQITA